MTSKREYSAATYVLIPAVAMLLGWGLRGYIGGGPYGAMIPGCFVALTICLLLGNKPETAALGALFGTVGIGIGGEMTYGQTLGFLFESDTLWWGILGCTIKGGVWGLLGGAILGLGLSRDKYDRKSVIIGMALMVIAYHVGRELINEPKLLYFSNREDRPRGESWAGLLFGAGALLAYMRSRGTAEDFRVPLRFALYGCVGGALGFGGGCLWLAFGPPVKWIGWWKMMEFSFGFILGGALGLCAYHNRDALRVSGQQGETPGRSWGPVWGIAGVVVAIFASYLLVDQIVSEDFWESGTFASVLVRKFYGVLVSYPFVAAMSVFFALQSLHAAWQVAVSLTFFHTVFDYTQDLGDVKNFGFELSTPVQWIFNIGLTVAIGYCATLLQRGRLPIERLLLLVLWACYGTACARSFLNLNILRPADGAGVWSTLVTSHPSIFFVHGTFTVSAIITTWWVLQHSKAQD